MTAMMPNQMKANYTTFNGAASSELELVAKREDNGKELRCEASNPAIEGSLVDSTTIRIECKSSGMLRRAPFCSRLRSIVSLIFFCTEPV